MSEVLSLLLKISAILISINFIYSVVMFAKTKNSYYKKYMLLWGSSSLNFVLQGIVKENDFLLSAAMGISFFYVLIFVDIISSATKKEYNQIHYVILYAAMNVLSFVNYNLGLNFTLIALPIAFAVGYPAIHFSVFKLGFPENKNWLGFIFGCFATVILFYNNMNYIYGLATTLMFLISAIVYEIRTLHIKSKHQFEHKIYLFSLVILGTHYLDYPFLRKIPDAAFFGFSLALVMVLIFSYLLNAIAVFSSVEENKERLESEVRERVKEIQAINNTDFSTVITLQDRARKPITVEKRRDVLKNVMSVMREYQGGNVNIVVDVESGAIELKKEKPNLTLVQD